MHKRLNILIAILIILLIPVTVFAVTTMSSSDKASGSFSRKYIDRLNIEITNTNFTLSKKSNNKHIITFNFKAEKTEPDFYAIINNFTINGLNCESVVFTPQNDNCDGSTLTDLILPVKNGKAVSAEYRVDVTFTTENTSISPIISLEYTSGITQLTSEHHLLEIPIKIDIK